MGQMCSKKFILKKLDIKHDIDYTIPKLTFAFEHREEVYKQEI